MIIGNNVSIINKDNDYILIDGNNCIIEIGDNTSIQSAHINAQEDNSYIKIGKGCMMSDGIIILTSDSHPIYDMETSERLNHAKSISIGDNVWIAQRSTIMKGVKIGNGSIVGLGSIVTKDIPEHSLAVGTPAKTIKRNVKWESHL